MFAPRKITHSTATNECQAMKERWKGKEEGMTEITVRSRVHSLVYCVRDVCVEVQAATAAKQAARSRSFM